MEFRIADTFTDSLARLTGQEQKMVKTAAFDLQLDPANPSMSFLTIGEEVAPVLLINGTVPGPVSSGSRMAP